MPVEMKAMKAMYKIEQTKAKTKAKAMKAIAMKGRGTKPNS